MNPSTLTHLRDHLSRIYGPGLLQGRHNVLVGHDLEGRAVVVAHIRSSTTTRANSAPAS